MEQPITGKILRERRKQISDKISILYDMPDSVINADLENEELFYIIVEIITTLQRLVTKNILSEDELVDIGYDFNAGISKVLANSLNTNKISEILNYIHAKIDMAFEMSLDLECYEITANIKTFYTLY
jgi:hypothetical protein